MSIQTTVTAAPLKGYAGQLAEVGAPSYRVSAAVSQPSVNVLAPGKIAMRGADGVAKPVDDAAALAATNMLGVVMYEASREPGAFEVGEDVTVIRKGVVYVQLTEAVVAGDAVSYGTKTATLDQWGKTAGANNLVVPGARWASSGGIGDIVRLELGYIA